MNANKLNINTTKSQVLVIPFKSKLENVNINIAFNQTQSVMALIGCERCGCTGPP